MYFQSASFPCQHISENKFILLGQHSPHLLSCLEVFTLYFRKLLKFWSMFHKDVSNVTFLLLVFLADGCLDTLTGKHHF